MRLPVRLFPRQCSPIHHWTVNRLVAVSLMAAGLLMFAGPVAAEEPTASVPPDHAERMKQGLEVFKKDVRPVLVTHCLECHGQTVKADFDLSDRKLLMESGMVGEDAASSHLYDVITHAAEPHMPHKADKLPDATLAHIARWLDLGAPYDKPLLEKQGQQPTAGGIGETERSFWSFQPLQTSAPPHSLPLQGGAGGGKRDRDWPRTPIDRFILAKQEEAGLLPNPPADRRTLIRRAYFDLIGLPPMPDEVEAFVNEADPLAWEKLIDRLLDSPHYGERWARHWLDVARFAESHGYEQDYDRPHAYHYRDFLIRALNDDMPYDQFVRWQIAGDELAPDDPLALTATGFLGGGAFPTQLTEVEFESARYDELDDMLATTGSAMLGLSIGCARCHDHKFDPIPARDYYRLLATFTTTIRSEIDLQLKPDAEPVKAQVTSEGFPHMKHHADGRGYPHFYPETHLLERGDVDQKQEAVTQGFLQVLMRDGRDESHWQIEPPEGWTRSSFRRAALANWLTDPNGGAGHLAARVIVNRLWQHHFGRGIVATPNDFGLQGARPTHPELLDWLAVELIGERGPSGPWSDGRPGGPVAVSDQGADAPRSPAWSLKRLHKLMMTSAVYMQTNDFDEDRAHIDRENALQWRWTPRRLEGEAIRDAMLHVSGLLDATMHGPGTLDQNMRRRSIYFFIKRSQLVPVMMLFDWPEHLVSIGQRSTTTIAPQALLFMNSPQARQYAEGFAGRLTDHSPGDAIPMAWKLAFGREPTAQEQQATAAFLERQTTTYRESGQPNPERRALIDFCQTLMSMNEFVYLD